MLHIGKTFVVLLVLSFISCTLAIAQERPGFKDKLLAFSICDVNRRLPEQPAAPTDVQLRITLEGFLAETRLRMEVPNRTTEELAEGTLDFELPAGSVVTGLKLSVSGMMVEGVGVEKWLARQAYEREVGRRVDPALLSHLGDDRYRLQIYPLPRGQSRAVEIAWIQPLREASGRLFYDFPFASGRLLPFTSLTVLVPAGTLLRSENMRVQLKQEQMRAGTEYCAPAGPYSVAADFTLSVTDSGILGSTWTGTWAGERYASVRYPQSATIDHTVREVSVIWDSSLSRSYRTHHDEVELLLRCLTEMGARRVDLYELRNGVAPVGTFSDADRWNAVASALDRVVYDGHSAVADVVGHLAVRHGVPTIFVTSALEYPSGPLTDTPSPLAIVVGGEEPGWYSPVEQLRGATRGCVWYTSQRNTESGARMIASFLAERSRGAADSNMEFDARGNLRAVHAKGARAGGTAPAERSFTLIAHYPRYVEGLRILSNYQPRWWEYRNISELASRWNVVSPYSSLLVLETAEQYVRWGVTPPAEVPWDRAAYEAMLKEKAGQTAYGSSEIQTAQQLRKVLSEVDAWVASDHRGAGVPGPYADFFGIAEAAAAIPPKENSVGHSWGFCFPAGTPVWTTGGHRISIEELQIGAMVSSMDPESGQVVARRVAETQVHPYTGDMLVLHMGATRLEVTGNHPILVLSGVDLAARKPPADLPPGEQERLRTGRWVKARDLEPGDRLATGGGGSEILRSVERRSADGILVYNLTVDRSHTYLAGAAGIVVHNKGMAEATPSVATAGAPAKAAPSPSAVGPYEGSAVAPGQPAGVSTVQESFYGFRDYPWVSEPDAYRTYLKLRVRNVIQGGFYVEVARWFAGHGATDMALRVLSNLQELGVRGDASRIQGAMVFEALGMYDLALQLLESAAQASANPDIKLLTYLAELNRLAGRSGEVQSILRSYLPRHPNISGKTDSAATQAIGGAQLTLYMDALLLSGGRVPDLSAFDLTGLPGRGWERGLRIKALWPGNDPYGLMVGEPGGEAVFWDNFRSARGGFYWTAYFQLAGPDEYFILDPVPGEYRIYLMLKDPIARPQGSPDYEPVRVSVLMPAGTPGQRMRIFHGDAPLGSGYVPVGTIEVSEVR